MLHTFIAGAFVFVTVLELFFGSWAGFAWSLIPTILLVDLQIKERINYPFRWPTTFKDGWRMLLWIAVPLTWVPDWRKYGFTAGFKQHPIFGDANAIYEWYRSETSDPTIIDVEFKPSEPDVGDK